MDLSASQLRCRQEHQFRSIAVSGSRAQFGAGPVGQPRIVVGPYRTLDVEPRRRPGELPCRDVMHIHGVIRSADGKGHAATVTRDIHDVVLPRLGGYLFSLSL